MRFSSEAIKKSPFQEKKRKIEKNRKVVFSPDSSGTHRNVKLDLNNREKHKSPDSSGTHRNVKLDLNNREKHKSPDSSEAKNAALSNGNRQLAFVEEIQKNF